MLTDLELVNDPNTDIYVLTDIAKRSPQLWSKIAEHPNCSPELAQWARQMLQTQGDAQVEGVTPPSSSYVPRQVQSAPRVYKSKKSNSGIKILIAVLAVLAVVAVVFAGWALLSNSDSSKTAAKPAQTTETKADTKADTKVKPKSKAKPKAKPKPEKENKTETEAEREAARNPDGKNPTFDFDAMLKNDFSSANGRWEAPNGDVLTINDGIFLWEHDGKPFRAIYSPEKESKVPAEYREPNLKKRGYSTVFATEGKNVFGKLKWEPDDPNSNALIEIIFFPRDFQKGKLFQFNNPGTHDGSFTEARTANGEHKQAIILLKADHPEQLRSSSLRDLGALRVKCEECTGKDRYYE